MKSCCNIGQFSTDWNVAAPKFFSQSTCSDPYFGFNVGGTGNLTPHADLSPNYINTLNFSSKTCV